jgi:hypothetical protein
MGIVDASPEFDEIQSKFDSSADPILDYLQGFALDAASLAIGSDGSTASSPGQLAFLTDLEMDNEDGGNIVGIPSSPTEPEDADILQQALDYLDWLKSEALSMATFPDYTAIEEAAPTEPTLDTGDPEVYTINEIAAPVYDVPVWDDSSAWSGGDVAGDGTVGPLIAPFTWSGGSYTSELEVGGNNVLYDKIKADLQTDDYGVSDLTDGELWDRGREREDKQTKQAVDDAVRLFARGGFSSPTGAAAAAIARANAEGRDRSQNINRDVLIQQSALFLDAKRVAVEAGLQIESLGQGFFNAGEDRLLRRLAQEITSTVEVAAFNVERIRMHSEKYAAFARAFEARVNGAKGLVDLYSAQVDAEGIKANVNRTLVDNLIAKNKNLIDIYDAQVRGFASVMDARVRYHGVLSDVYKTQVSNVNAHIDATKGAYDLVDKQHKTKVDFTLGKYATDVANTRARIELVSNFIGFKIDQLKAQSQAAVSIATAAMSALNVNLGLSLGGQTSISGSESHAYDETKGDDYGNQHLHTYDETKGDRPGEVRTVSEQTVTANYTNTNYNYSGSI